MKAATSLLAAALAGLVMHAAARAEISGAEVRRDGADALDLTWTSPDPVDVYGAERPDAPVAGARLLARGVRSGAYVVHDAGRTRRYFTLVDARDRQALKVAERLVPLDQGSNFRDVGGYPAAGGKHVRWGLIYRSGAQPLLTAEDVARLRGLGLAQLVDLRSDEERRLAPTAIDGVPYTAIGYPMGDLTRPAGLDRLGDLAELYRRFPHLLAPQLKVLFADLLGRRAPLVFNCSAGQDRTGFATAMILSALGVPRETIYADYELSTAYRRPQFEMPKIDLAAHAGDPVARLFAYIQDRPELRKPTPLVGPDGRPYLVASFAEMDRTWGSVDAYLRREVGLTPADIAALRRLYLE